MSILQAVLFDMDGTLSDTEELHRTAFNLAFHESGCGWQWTMDEYRELLIISGGRQRIHHYIQLKEGLSKNASKAKALAIHTLKSEIYRELLTRNSALRPGVARLIGEARETGIRMAIVTSSSRKNVDTLLAHTLGADAAEMFESIVSCEKMESQKPSPHGYLTALAEMNVDPGNCIAIEDTQNGNLSALAAGIKTVITTHRFTLDDDFKGASLVLDKLGEPDQPVTVASGGTLGKVCVDMELLRQIVIGYPHSHRAAV